MNVASIFETCCSMIFIVGIVLSVAIMLYFKKRNGGNKMFGIGNIMNNLRQLKNDNDALIGMGFLGVILVFIIVGVLIISIISIVWGIFTLIGMCLLIASAYILIMKKGAVVIAPNSVFMWMIIIGLILVFFGQFVMDIGSVDLGVIPGLEAIHNIVR